MSTDLCESITRSHLMFLKALLSGLQMQLEGTLRPNDPSRSAKHLIPGASDGESAVDNVRAGSCTMSRRVS